MLALAALSFGRPSETFVHNHARLLAPGRSVLVCSDESGADRFGYPVFEAASPPKIRNRLSRRWISLTDPVLAGVNPVEYASQSTRERDRLVSFLRQHGVRVMLAEYATTALKFVGACRRANIPLFAHFHGWDANILGNSPTIRRRYQRLFKEAEGVIVTTEFLKRRVMALGCSESKIITCPCGVDTDLFSPGEETRGERVLMVSRLILCKGPQFSLKSFALATRRRPHAFLEIIGEGGLREDLERTAVELGLADRVVFHGARDNTFVRDRMRQCRLLIQHCVTLPNKGVESQGLSVLEAMSCGLPVVATHHGAFRETVQDGVTGRLVDEGDTSAMAAAIEAILDDPVRAAQMGRAGRESVISRYEQVGAIRRLRAVLGIEWENT